MLKKRLLNEALESIGNLEEQKNEEVLSIRLLKFLFKLEKKWTIQNHPTILNR